MFQRFRVQDVDAGRTGIEVDSIAAVGDLGIPLAVIQVKLAGDRFQSHTHDLFGDAHDLAGFVHVTAGRAEQCARFKYRNCGQVCASPSRFYVHESVYQAFCARFAEVAASLQVGPGLDPDTAVGPMANRRGLDHAQALIADALARGSRLLVGGGRPASVPGDKGYYLAPTALADVAMAWFAVAALVYVLLAQFRA